jgi:hypothetical protein
MSKDKLTDYDSTTASNNTDVGGISVAEGMLPSAVNNSIRELTKQLGAFADGTDGIDVLSLADDDASHAIKLQAPSAVTADTTFTLPDGDGVSGQTMITDGAGALSWAAPYGNRNLIINGDMAVSQRSVSEAGVTTSGYKTVDRFRASESSLGTAVFTHAQATDAPDGFANSLKLTTTTAEGAVAADDRLSITYAIEGQDLQHLQYGTSSAKKVTLSFYVKSSLTGTYSIALYATNASNRLITSTYTINSANAWELKTITFDGDTSVAFTNDNTAGLTIYFNLGAGSDSTSTDSTSWIDYASTGLAYGQTAQFQNTLNATWQVTAVQLEIGDTATPFEHRSYADELLRCQRYFYRPFLTSGTSEDTELGLPRFYASRYSTSAGYVYITYPVSMRKNPNLTYSVTGGAIDNDHSSYVKAQLKDGNGTAFYIYNFQAEAEL